MTVEHAEQQLKMERLYAEQQLELERLYNDFSRALAKVEKLYELPLGMVQVGRLPMVYDAAGVPVVHQSHSVPYIDHEIAEMIVAAVNYMHALT